MKRIGQWALLWVLALATAGYLVFWPGGAVQTVGPMDSGRPVLVLDAGRTAEEGPAAELLAHPRSEAARRLLAAVPRLTGRDPA